MEKFASGTSAGHTSKAAFDFNAKSDYASVNALIEAGNYNPVSIGTISFKGTEKATMAINPQERGESAGNVNDHTVFNDVVVHRPMKRLDIQAGAEAGQHIIMEWSPLDLTVLGISGTNMLTAEFSRQNILEQAGTSLLFPYFGKVIIRMHETPVAKLLQLFVAYPVAFLFS